MLVLALENQRQGWLHHVCVSTGCRETKVKFTCCSGSQIPDLSSWKPIRDGSRDSPEVYGGGRCWISHHMWTKCWFVSVTINRRVNPPGRGCEDILAFDTWIWIQAWSLVRWTLLLRKKTDHLRSTLDLVLASQFFFLWAQAWGPVV